ncbi:hypothetical protein GCM10023347_43530 [Streptomyces chumphonensis]|uniref:Uncharacterized protein n=1 Tax=Streptomyces chumphonensis TaxID=1214925 RepID=A0A927F396_9ACTN|nr:hypothetical protein [Streptomyces chumphonensis]MBD3934190.1 hypothetical protein [Streptomyces chumphonensis]
MLLALIIAAEIGFWVLLALGLALRYLARMPRAGLAVLLCEPLLEVVLLVATAADLRDGGEPGWRHGLAAVYIGFTVTHGHYLVRWADARFAHRFAGGPPPVRPPRYGSARAAHEWRMSARAIGAAAIAAGLLQAAIWYVGDAGDVAPLRAWQGRMEYVAGLAVLIALGYTIWPKRPPKGAAGDRASAASAGRPQR